MILNNKQKNFIKYFLPILASILTFVTLGQFYSSKLNESDLKEVIGKVTSIKKDRYRHHKYTDDRITIFIEGHSEPFYFFENNSCSRLFSGLVSPCSRATTAKQRFLAVCSNSNKARSEVVAWTGFSFAPVRF